MKLGVLKEKIESAGVVGAGGAGFPMQCKLSGGIDTVIVNASECEPLLYTDSAILKRHPAEVLEGAEAVRDAAGARRIVIGINSRAAVRLGLSDGKREGGRCIIKLLPDVYPMGDEVVLIYQILGRVVPPGRLPSSVGVVVMNVETAFNVANAVRGIPVTKKWLTVGGDIPVPRVYRVPVGSNVCRVLEAAGVGVPEGDAVLDGGPAMGNVIDPDTAVVTKKTKALIVLPGSLPAVRLRKAVPERLVKRMPLRCCQCGCCTEICPRFLLGYPVRPHAVLRAAASVEDCAQDFSAVSLCSQCGLCTLVACRQNAAPSVVMGAVKKILGRKNIVYRADRGRGVDPERENRLIPVGTLLRRIGVERFDRTAEFGGDLSAAQRVYRLPLSQHVGRPSVPVVEAGTRVSAGDRIAEPAGGISAALHAPISGTVTAVTDSHIEITANEVN